MKTVAVLGAGAWGTSVATLLAESGVNVRLWCHEPHVEQAINKTRSNEHYLPGIVLDDRIQATSDLAEALADVTWIFEAVPVKFLRSVLRDCVPFYNNNQIWVVLSKGIEQEALMLPTHMLEDVFGDEIQTVVLAGPSFAHELASKQPTGMVIASDSEHNARALQAMLKTPYFLSQFSDDVLGLQLGGALKNVLALGIGMLEGAGYGDNIKALFCTQGLHEAATLAEVIGAQPITLFGLGGLGDLVLTAFGTSSRNLLVGRALGAGQSLEIIVSEIRMTPEGVNTAQALYQLLKEADLDLPLFNGIYHVMCGVSSISDVVQAMFVDRA